MPYATDKLFDERTCPVCGKSFFKPPETVYKYRDHKGKTKYVCSYTCWMKKLRELGKA